MIDIKKLYYNVDSNKELSKEEKKIYGLRYDLIFKNVFSDKKLLRQFFRNIYHEEIGDFTYRDKET